MRDAMGNDEAVKLALGALVWTLGDAVRAGRLLGLTGLDPAGLRAGAASGDPALLAATLEFLERHEPDLIAAADTIETTPAALVAARQWLEDQCARS